MGATAIPRKYVAVAAVGIVALVIAFSPPRVGSVVTFVALSGAVLVIGTLVEALRRRSTELSARSGHQVERVVAAQEEERSIARHRTIEVRSMLRECLEELKEIRERGEREQRERSAAATPQGTGSLRRAQDLLWCGFSEDGLKSLRELGSDLGVAEEVRSESHRCLANWYTAAGEVGRARDHAHLADLAAPRASREATGVPRRVALGRSRNRRERHFDVVVMSDFRSPGGSTSSNLQEIIAQRGAGLRTGLVHHPVRGTGLSQGVNPKVLAVVDGDLVRFVTPDERVTCDLLVVRVPRIGERIMDDMPRIEAARSVVVLDQVPEGRHGTPSPLGEGSWNLSRCAEGFGRLLGEHRWYPVDPRVREAMLGEHAAELDAAASFGITLADEDWSEVIDASEWRRAVRRSSDSRVLLGRHSPDTVDKWPDGTAELLDAYPQEPGWQVRVLGGASFPERVLGELPSNWQVHPFDSMPVREFLHGLDVYAYFPRRGRLGAFDRAPLEALATGVPTLLPESFRTVFGDAAIYTDPAGVRAEVAALMADEERYARQIALGHEVVEREFGHDTHLRRLSRLGVGVAEFDERRVIALPTA